MGTDPTGMFDDWTCEYGGCYPTITVTTSVCLSCYVEYFSVMMDMSGPVNGLMPDPVLPAAPWCNPYFLSGCGTGGVNYFPPTLPNNCQFVLANPCGSSGSTPPTVKGKQPQSPPSSPNACEQQNLNAVNNQFGTGFTTSNVDVSILDRRSGRDRYVEPGHFSCSSIPVQWNFSWALPGQLVELHYRLRSNVAYSSRSRRTGQRADVSFLKQPIYGTP
jgi:hypothetical protein